MKYNLEDLLGAVVFGAMFGLTPTMFHELSLSVFHQSLVLFGMGIVMCSLVMVIMQDNYEYDMEEKDEKS